MSKNKFIITIKLAMANMLSWAKFFTTIENSCHLI
jgi:hypothetical protein